MAEFEKRVALQWIRLTAWIIKTGKLNLRPFCAIQPGDHLGIKHQSSRNLLRPFHRDKRFPLGLIFFITIRSGFVRVIDERRKLVWKIKISKSEQVQNWNYLYAACHLWARYRSAMGKQLIRVVGQAAAKPGAQAPKFLVSFSLKQLNFYLNQIIYEKSKVIFELWSSSGKNGFPLMIYPYSLLNLNWSVTIAAYLLISQTKTCKNWGGGGGRSEKCYASPVYFRGKRKWK